MLKLAAAVSFVLCSSPALASGLDDLLKDVFNRPGAHVTHAQSVEVPSERYTVDSGPVTLSLTSADEGEVDDGDVNPDEEIPVSVGNPYDDFVSGFSDRTDIVDLNDDGEWSDEENQSYAEWQSAQQPAD